MHLPDGNMSKTFPCSVVLAAHGSLAEETSNDSLFELAQQVAASQIFSTVTPAFLNGLPSTSTVMSGLPAGDLVVIPVMTSDGYYVQNILPTALAENSNFESFRIFVSPPLGLHPEIASLVADRVSVLMNLLQLDSAETTIIVVGHGTRRNLDSSKSTEQLAARVQEHLPTANIRVAFIDQEPAMLQVIGEITTPHMLVVPFLIARGPHATVDVPAAFGLPTGPNIEFPLVDFVGNGLIVCDLPVGLYPEMAELCIELATDQLLSGTPVHLAEIAKRKLA